MRAGSLGGLARGILAAAVCVLGSVVMWRILDRHAPVGDWFVWQLLKVWGYALYFTIASLAAGNAALRLLLKETDLPPVEWVLQSMLLGVVVFGLAMYAAGALFLFSWPWALLLPALMIAVGVAPGRRSIGRLARWWQDLPRERARARAVYWLIGSWGVICLGFVYLGALHPSAINFDAAWYHIPIAQDYAREGGIVAFPAENHRAYPHLASILYTWALLVPGLDPLPLKWMLILHLEFVAVLFRIVGVVAGAQYFLGRDRTPAIWVVFFLFPSIFVYDQNIGGAADQVIAFSGVPVFLALARLIAGLDLRYAILLGAALGCHMLTKYQAVYLMVAVGLVLGARCLQLAFAKVLRSLRTRGSVDSLPSWRRLLGAPALAFAVTALTWSPHVIKNVAYHGNPLYPLASSVFTTSHPVQPAGYYQQLPRKKEFALEGEGLERQARAARLLFTYSFETGNRDLTGHRPYMGSLLSLLLPCLPFVRRSRRLWIGLAVFFGAFLVWANTGANDRYLLGFYGIGMAITAGLLVRVWQLGWVARLALVPLVALQVFWGGDAMLTYGGKRVRAAMSLMMAARSGKIDARFAKMQAVQRRITAGTPPDARILARNYKDLLGLDRTVLSDIREMQGLITYSGIRSPREMWQELRDHGVTHLMYPEGSRRPHRWNATVLFEALVHGAPKRKRFGGLVIVPLRDEPPPASESFLVLVSGVREFPDGLYPVEQLDVDDRYPQRFKPSPRPMKRLNRRNAAELVREADAVVSGGRALPGDGQAALREFEAAERFGSRTVFLRRR